jgi:F-type H+-transporting ATPase subunit b
MLIFTDGLIDPQSITDKLIPNGIWPFIIQLLSTFVMLIIVHKFLYKPVKGILDKRAAFVEQSVQNAIERESLAQDKLTQLEKDQVKTKKALQTLRQQAEEEIDAQKTRLLDEAKRQAAALKLKANEEIGLARKQAQAQLEEEIIHVALAASPLVLQRELTEKDNDKMVEQFIKDLKN